MIKPLKTSLHALLVLALVSPVRIASPQPLDLPEARTRSFETDDMWLFDAAPSAFSAETYQLSQAMSRTAGALSHLRGILAQMNRHALVPAAQAAFDAPVGWTADDADLFEDIPEFFPRASQIQNGSLSLG
jgi:hypothetical protein